MMRIKAITCEVLARQAYYVAAFSPHVIDIELISKGLHTEPERLHAELQRRLDACQPGQFDAVLLAYGLCSNSIAGLMCPHTQMVAPRAHDCITLYLGSKDRYSDEFREHPGTYWYTPDYMERGGDNSDRVALGASTDENMDQVYAEYVAKYGKDNADYLMEVMGAWRQHYDRAAYIENQDIQLPDYSAKVSELASRRGWNFQRLAGNLFILRDLFDGRWDEERFLIVPPGDTIVPTYDARIIACQRPA
jgi:hypothetical protein